MTMPSPRILTIYADKLFDYYPKQRGEENAPYCFDLMNRFFSGQVIKQTSDFDECPLLHQIIVSETFKNESSDNKTDKYIPDITVSDDYLLDKLMIVDFSNVFFRITDSDKAISIKQKIRQDRARDLIENGFDVRFSDDHKAHMVPFDKSGNMSRQSRISFINEKYVDELNRRLNLDMDFSDIKVVLSKYYAYRGLYLTSSKRVYHQDLTITPETLVILKDQRLMKKPMKNPVTGEEHHAPVLGYNYERNVPIATADPETGEFINKEEEELSYVSKPFDGVGIVSPEYAGYINAALGVSGATSFQVRMPFVKGMVHKVDFKAFLDEFDTEKWNAPGEYFYEDAFGIKRDLKKAQILITESMFKGFEWLRKYCDDRGCDPMAYYCGKFNKYDHALYISGTNLPYGHTEFTHLSYQMINTLDLDRKGFDKLIKNHRSFINDPERYISLWDSSEVRDFEDTEIFRDIPAWKKALKKDPDLKNDSYIASQLRNTSKGLITKIANGKIVVAGQTRFLCRDLMLLLACLIEEESAARKFYRRLLFFRFYMPGAEDLKGKYENLQCDGFCAFFRSPHLSRNEQCLLQPFVIPSGKGNDIYYREDDWKTNPEEDFKENVRLYDRYFGELTGVVMVPRGSIVPLCLGGADFDGDLVSVIYDETVVDAVRKACYTDKWLYRKLPVVRIPDEKNDTKDYTRTVPPSVPYEHILNTFSNAIGYLSNAAISIGQKEYGSKDYKNDNNSPACWKCTILTGLEIDAAKKGKHPDLGIISKNKKDYPDARYLGFKDTYESVRKLPSFNFDRMEIVKRAKPDSDEYEIDFSIPKDTSKACKCVISGEDHGTAINRLPFAFIEEHDRYASKAITGKKQRFSSPFRMADRDKGKEVLISSYRSDCKKLIDLFFNYKHLIDSIRFEKNRSKYGRMHISKLAAKIYDTENDAMVNAMVIPELIDLFNAAISKDASVKELKNSLNDRKWQFQPEDKRAKTLEKIIGNGFSVSDLSDAQKDILFHFGQQGYKMLWHILTAVDDMRIRPLTDIRNDNDINAADAEDNPADLINELNENVAGYYYDNLTDIENRLYHICLKRLRKMIEDTGLEPATKIHVLYEIAGNNPKWGRFFWDAFTWEELDASIPLKEGGADHAG